jgi:cytochrome c556
MPDDHTDTDVNREVLWEKMDKLAQRMGARLLEFRNRSDCAQLRGQLTRIAERHRNLRDRFEAAQGNEWDATKHEIAESHRDLFEEFVKFEEKLDRSEREHPGRAPGATSGLV